LFHAPLDGTNTAFELITAETLHTCSSVIFEAASLHGLAATSLGNIVAALTRIATIIIVRFAVRDHTLIVFEFKGFEAFKANMISLF
jgi:hypothetical protein